jgi:hypothetical protein
MLTVRKTGTTSVVDRLTFHAHIIQTGTSSYRLSASRSKKGAADT